MNNVTKNSIIPSIQGYFATLPITKAWLFGSYSRGEESAESDVDILVAFDKDAKISLFKYADMICQLENLLQQKNQPNVQNAKKQMCLMQNFVAVVEQNYKNKVELRKP